MREKKIGKLKKKELYFYKLANPSYKEIMDMIFDKLSQNELE